MTECVEWKRDAIITSRLYSFAKSARERTAVRATQESGYPHTPLLWSIDGSLLILFFSSGEMGGPSKWNNNRITIVGRLLSYTPTSNKWKNIIGRLLHQTNGDRMPQDLKKITNHFSARRRRYYYLLGRGVISYYYYVVRKKTGRRKLYYIVTIRHTHANKPQEERIEEVS